jgi:hypothetical protein
MTPVYQTLFNAGTVKGELPGNCLQAAIASLLDMRLDDIPHFMSYGDDDWFKRYKEFLHESGYHYERTLHNPRDIGYDGCHKTWASIIKKLKGVNGYFLATVHSPTYFTPELVCAFETTPTHAVIIDRDFNIVHDPNPNNKGIKEYPMPKFLWPNGIMAYDVINKR